jgi:hypothetical protein
MKKPLSGVKLFVRRHGISRTVIYGFLFWGWLTGQAFGQATVRTLTDAHHGKAGYKDGSTFYNAQFRNPMAIALDASGQNMFVADNLNNTVRFISNLGNNSSSFTYTLVTNKGLISSPVDIAVDANTNIFVLNRGNGLNGNILEFNGNLLQYNRVFLAGTNAAKLNNATAMALDSTGKIYVGVSSNTVICVTPGVSTNIVGIITAPGAWIRGMAAISSGKLAITDGHNNGIWIMDPGNTNIFSNTTQLCGFNGAGDATGPGNIAAFNQPEKIARAGGGFLVVADYNNNKVKVVDTNGTVNRLFGNSKKYWYGNYKGWADGTVNPNEFLDRVMADQPEAVAVDNNGNVYDTEIHYALIRTATGTGLPVLPPPPPGAPVIWSVVTNLTLDQVTISWSPVSGSTSYYVKRTKVSPSNNFNLIATTAGTNYTDTIAEGVDYYYEVSAVNDGGEGPNSGWVHVKLSYRPVPDPSIGYVTFPTILGGGSLGSKFTAVTNTYTMNQPTPIVFEEADGFLVNYAFAAAGTNNVIPSNFPYSVPLGYSDGHPPYEVTAYDIYSVISQYPDVVVSAVASSGNTNIPNSSTIQVEFIFQTGNPIITGTNAAEFTLTDPATPGSYYLYTTDGSEPSPTNGIYTTSVTNHLSISANTLLKVKAYYENYHPSVTVSNLFYFANYHPSTACFGFASGPASSQFIASPGQHFYVPVGLDFLPDTPPIYGLQFNVTLTNMNSSTVDSSSINFASLIGVPDGLNDGYYYPIPPLTFISDTQPNNNPNAFDLGGSWYQSLDFSNTNNNDLLAIGWLEVLGRTNLYNTKNQNLLTYPIMDGTDPVTNASQIVVGRYSFTIPTNANPGDAYQIQLHSPSATTFPGLNINPYGVPVSLYAPANTNMLGGGSENALKNVTLGQIKYLVGDVYPANWYNAGDFGSSNLVNVDVMRVFDFAAYPIAHPPEDSDLFDALDSSGNVGVWDPTHGYFTNTVIYSYQTEIPYPSQVTTTYYYATNNATTINDAINNLVTSTSSTSWVTNFVYMSTVFLDTYNTNIVITVASNTPPYGFVTMNTYLDTVSNNVVAFNFTNGFPIYTLFNGTDTNINQVAFGDGQLDICDVYVTYRRSQDSSLIWFERFWTNGMRVADTNIPNHAAKAVAKKSTSNSVQPKVSNTGVPPSIVFTAGSVQTKPGQTVQVPISVNVSGDYPLRLLMFNMDVLPQNGAPDLTSQVQFTQTATVLGTPYGNIIFTKGTENCSAFWLNYANNGITGNTPLGYLTVTIPDNAPTNGTYNVLFEHASGSPNGLVSFPNEVYSGTILLNK